MIVDDPRFRHGPDPDNPGWHIWHPKEDGRFNAVFGKFGVRRDGDRATVRIWPHRGLTNPLERIHGGALLGFIDGAMFGGAAALGAADVLGGLTVDVSAQMVGAGDADRPLDAIIEITRQTGRFVFVRGTLQQDDDMVASFIGTLMKARQ